MLTRRSSAASRVKMLVFIPLALVCTVCFSKNSFSQKFERKGNTVIYRGNTFEYNQNNRVDTQIIVDPVTGEEITKYIKFDPQLIKMNGEPIPQDVDKNPTYTGKEKDLRDYLLANLKKEIGQLEDGQYTLSISDVLIDRNGKIVYFNYEGGKKK